MQEEANKAVVRRWVEEIWNKGHLDLADQIFAPGIVNHNAPPGTPPGFEGWKRGAQAIYNGFPDVQNTIEDIIAEGDMVAWRWTAVGTHQGTFMGIPPTGKQTVLRGINIVRFADGKIVELWQMADNLDMLRQVGVLS